MNIVPITRPVILPDHKYNEEIVAIKRSLLFSHEVAWHGIRKVDIALYTSLIQHHHEYVLRGLAENDVNYKQIIPYVVFKYQDTYFLMQRDAHATDSRLSSKYTLGIGGHLQKNDIINRDLLEWGAREFEEEVDYTGELSYEILGILNDDSNDVGKVHIGIVICATGTSDAISVKSELTQGTLVNLETCLAHFKKLESWSQHVVTFLHEQL